MQDEGLMFEEQDRLTFCILYCLVDFATLYLSVRRRRRCDDDFSPCDVISCTTCLRAAGAKFFWSQP